jgi:hypothetical protein
MKRPTRVMRGSSFEATTAPVSFSASVRIERNLYIVKVE